MINYLSRKVRKAILIIFILFNPAIILGQTYSGRIIISGTETGIGFVNIGIIGKNIGTVSDINGNFTINLSNDYDNDSLRISIIGYESQNLLIKDFKENSTKKIFLSPRSYSLKEVKVTYHKYKKLRLGNPVMTNDLRSGFADNELGSELGIKVYVPKQAILRDINLNVGICTFDSVTYRLNIYRIVNEELYINILTEPIYISFSKNEINNVIVYDLRKYSITVKGDILITLELYKDLGEGKLLFDTEYFTGITFHRKTSQGNWTQSPGVIGMYLNCLIIN
jgi:hypothetical protein